MREPSHLRRWRRTLPILRRLRRTLAAAALALAAAAGGARAEMALLMVEQAGCVYCAQWDREISAIYPKTDEGRAAPLRRHALRAPTPLGVTLDRPPLFTPTFILLDDGREVGRIEGYPGEAFFWGLLGGLLKQAAER